VKIGFSNEWKNTVRVSENLKLKKTFGHYRGSDRRPEKNTQLRPS
jgi:hypothetical protein